MKLDHVAFQVANMDRALEFYTRTLGLKLMFDKTSEEHRERFVFLELEGGNLELLEKHDEEGNPIPTKKKPPEPPYCPHVAIGTEDLDRIVETLENNGIPLLKGPLLIEGQVRWLYFCDPDDNVLEYVQWL
ncbi:MAG: VOC family protein [Candidatus Omnitrophica bacterium]|nr:VOC family protein [Candidatus Omnitrophota bacterium]